MPIPTKHFRSLAAPPRFATHAIGVLLLLLCAAAGPLPQADAQGRGGETYPEPKPDLALPVGTPDPLPAAEVPAEPLAIDRTGTYGGTLVYSVLGEIDTFNPVEPKGATSQELRSMIFSGLVGYNNGLWETEPLLATRWEVSEDRKTWTFHLRRGIRWSDGEPLDIDDVAFSFRAIFHPGIHSSIQDGFRDEKGRLPTFTVDAGEQTITFVTPEVSSQFLTHVGNVSIIPEHKWKDDLQAEKPTLLERMTSDSDPASIIGCGPFVLKRYVPAEKIEYARNPHYFEVDARGKRLPYVDRVVVVLVKDNNLQVQKFLAGEHHLMNDFPPDRFKEADNAAKQPGSGFELLRLGLSLNTYWVAFNLHPGTNDQTGQPFVSPEKLHWFGNISFRRAVNHAIDRDGMVKTAFEGRGRPIWASITPGNRLFFHKDVPRYEHSKERANELLDSLGWRDTDGDGVREDDQKRPIRFTLNTNAENTMRTLIGTLIKDDLSQVGIDLTFKPIDFNGLVTRLQDSHDWDMALLGWGSGVPPDPSNSKNILGSGGRLHVWYPGQPAPATEWEARVDQLIGLMDRELDHEKRKGYSDEIQVLTAEQCPIVYMVAPNAYALAKTEVGNLWPSVLRPSTTWNIAHLYLKSAAPGDPR